ncbi:MAG: hypothetical protein QOF99_7380, partial [Pseudonocardiales bacterium]|nr:hypothetical protein [Pseudonocardiales bacterium]
TLTLEVHRWQPGAEPGQDGAGGPLAIEGMDDPAVAAFRAILPRLPRDARAKGRHQLGFSARGPPVLFLDAERARPLLAEVGLADLPERLIAFGWRHPELGDVIVMFGPTADRLSELRAAGVLADSWWTRVVTHELGHLNGHWQRHGGRAHADDADDLLDELFRAGRGGSGARKPHGSELAGWWLGWLFTGEEMTPARRVELADRLARRLAETARPAGFTAQADELHELVLAAIQLLRGEPLGRRWRGVGPVRVHQLDNAASPLLSDPVLGLTANAGHVLSDGIRRIYAAEEVGVLHGLVESELAPALGFTPAQAHVLAVLAERLVDGPDHLGEPWRRRPGWLTARAGPELATLATHNPAGRVLLVWDYEHVRARLETTFADLSGWRRLVLRYAEEFHRAAVDHAHVPQLTAAELDQEYREALVGLRQLIAAHPDRRYRRALARALRHRERAAHGPHRWEIEVELRALRSRTEQAGIWPTDIELVYVAVRNITWARLTATPALRELRWWAADTLLGTASAELAPLLRPDYQLDSSGRLVRIEPSQLFPEENGPHSGAVLKGSWRSGEQGRVNQILPELEKHAAQPRHDPAAPRGPPILEVPLTDAVLALLTEVGVADLPDRLVGYFWAERGVVVIFSPVLTQLRAAGLLARLLHHEDAFHRRGRIHNDHGVTHDHDAAQIVALLTDRPRRGDPRYPGGAWSAIGRAALGRALAPFVAGGLAAELTLAEDELAQARQALLAGNSARADSMLVMVEARLAAPGVRLGALPGGSPLVRRLLARRDGIDHARLVLDHARTLLVPDRAAGVEPSAAYWGRFWPLLDALATVPREQRTRVHRMLARGLHAELGRPLRAVGDADWSFLARPGWLATRLSVDGVAPSWLAAFWTDQGTTLRARLALALTVAAVGPLSPDRRWPAELVARQRSEHRLRALALLWVDPGLAAPAAAVAELLGALPAEGRLRAHFLGVWLALARAVARYAPLLTELGHPGLPARTLARLHSDLLGAHPVPAGAAIALLRDAPRELAAALTAELGALLGARLPATTALDPSSELFRALIGYHPVRRPELTGMFARYLEVWSRTGGDRHAASGAFWVAWERWWRAALGPGADAVPVARALAPADLPVVLPDGTRAV